MPQHFKFAVDGDVQFECDITARQCIAPSKAGPRCRNQVAIGTPYCWNHLRSLKHLRVKESKIRGAGKGVFAEDPSKGPNAVVFHEDDVIIEYGGDIIDKAELDRRYGDYTAPYGIVLSRNAGIYEDAACRRGAGAIVNQSNRANGNNVRLSKRHRNGQFYAAIVAIRDIKNGRELYADYGDEYDMGEEGVVYGTRYKSPPRQRRRQ